MEEITHVRQHPGLRMDYISQMPCNSGQSWTSEMRANIPVPILYLKESDISSHLAIIQMSQQMTIPRGWYLGLGSQMETLRQEFKCKHLFVKGPQKTTVGWGSETE